MDTNGTWIRALGWQHEKPHTAVLHEVLLDDSAGPACLTALLGVEVDAVWDLEREVSAGGAPRTRADLAARIQVNGEQRRLAVETKVHSKASELQVIRTTYGPDAMGLILAPGRTGLRWRDEDVARMNRQSEGVQWVRATTLDWHRGLTAALGGREDVPGWIADYQGVLACKAGALAAALEKAEHTGVNHAEACEFMDASAWLSAMRGHLDDPEPGDWSGDTKVSGEVLYSTCGPDRWHDPASGAELYLSFEIKPDHLRLQLRAGGGAPREVFQRLRDNPHLVAVLKRAGLNPPVTRRFGSTCEVAGKDLLMASAAEGADVVRAVVVALEDNGLGQRALEEAGRGS